MVSARSDATLPSSWNTSSLTVFLLREHIVHVKTYGRLTVRAVRALRDVESAERWLKSPMPLLDGRSPLEALGSAEGTAKVEKQLKCLVGHPLLHSDHDPP